MAVRIKSKKQLIKLSEAARLLHSDMVWMWARKDGDVLLSTAKPIEAGEIFGYTASSPSTTVVCKAGVDLKISAMDTLVQLKTASNP